MLAGSMSDRFGRRRVFQIGLAVFTLASLLCSQARTIDQLIGHRALQGVGALLNPVALSIIGNPKWLTAGWRQLPLQVAIKPPSSETHLYDWNAGSVVLQHIGRQVPCRHQSQERPRQRGYLRNRKVNLDIGLKVNLNNSDTAVGLRFGVLDVLDAGWERALAYPDDSLGHVIIEAAVNTDHADDRDIDVRQNVGGHRRDGSHAENRNQRRDNNERVRPL
jgi:hypothetical protein